MSDKTLAWQRWSARRHLERLLRQAAGLLMPISTEKEDYPHVPRYYLRMVEQQNEKCRQAAISMRDAHDRIKELESVLKGKCPKCGEDMESNCYGQSTSCYSCEYVLQGLGGSDE